MISQKKGQELHDRASKGEKLKKEEILLLEEWYAEQDRIEAASLGLIEDAKTPSGLQVQIEANLSELIEITKRIQKVISENNSLRNENIALRNQLAHQFGHK